MDKLEEIYKVLTNRRMNLYKKQKEIEWDKSINGKKLFKEYDTRINELDLIKGLIRIHIEG